MLLEAASEAMRKAMTNKQVQKALKETVIDALQDEQLQQQLIATLTKAAILSSGDRLLRSHLLDVPFLRQKIGILGHGRWALKGKYYVKS